METQFICHCSYCYLHRHTSLLSKGCVSWLMSLLVTLGKVTSLSSLSLEVVGLESGLVSVISLCYSLGPCFSPFKVHINHLGGLIKTQILRQVDLKLCIGVTCKWCQYCWFTDHTLRTWNLRSRVQLLSSVP